MEPGPDPFIFSSAMNKGSSMSFEPSMHAHGPNAMSSHPHFMSQQPSSNSNLLYQPGPREQLKSGDLVNSNNASMGLSSVSLSNVDKSANNSQQMSAVHHPAMSNLYSSQPNIRVSFAHSN